MVPDRKAKEIERVLSNTQDEAQQIDEIASIRGWCTILKDSPHFAAVQNYLNDKIGLEEALKTYTDTMDEAIKAGNYDDAGGWNCIIHSAKRIPFRSTEGHTRLAEFIRAFKEHPDPPEAKEPVYATLPRFGMNARLAFDEGPGGSAGYCAPEVNSWINLNYFFARLTAAGVRDLYLYAIWAMRQALEQTVTDGLPSKHRIATKEQKYDAWVPAAAMWVFALGRKLYEKEEDLTPTSRQMGNPAKPGDLWDGRPEFSKSRWAFWKKRFGEVAAYDGVKESTSDIAREAVEAMDRAEQSQSQ